MTQDYICRAGCLHHGLATFRLVYMLVGYFRLYLLKVLPFQAVTRAARTGPNGTGMGVVCDASIQILCDSPFLAYLAPRYRGKVIRARLHPSKAASLILVAHPHAN